jgi:WD40 repeat protein
MSAPRYDAFISYSHAADGKLAPAIQRALHSLAKPWYRLRALRVFRDETSLSANPDLWAAIEKALAASKWFIYLASPLASRSEWVQREIDWWLTHHGSSSMLVVLTDGTLRWDQDGDSFDWSVTDAFPIEAARRLANEPLWVDLTWARNVDSLDLRHSRFRSAALRLAAPIHGRPLDDLDGDDVRQHRRNLLTARGAIASLVLLTAVSLAAAYIAVQRGRASVSRELAIYSLQQLEADPELSLRLALEAVASAGTPQAEDALRRALRESKVITTLGTPGQVSRAKYAPDGRTILVVSYRDVALWRDGAVPVLRHPAIVSAAEFSRDGALVVTGAWDGKVRVWDVGSTNLLVEWQALDAPAGASGPASTINELALSPDRSLVVTAGGAPADSQSKIARVWDVKTGRQVSELRGHTASIAAIAFAPDGKRVATGAWDEAVMLWDAATGAALKTLTGHVEVANAVAFSRDGTSIVSVGLDMTVRSWNSSTGELQTTGGQPKALGPGDFGLDRATAISAGAERAFVRDAPGATVYDPATGKRVARLADFPSSCHTAAFSADASLLACAGQEGAAYVWSTETGQRIAVLRGHRGELNAVSFGPIGDVLLSAGTDNTVRMWRIEAGEGQTLTHERVTGIAWSPDGRLVATTGSNETVRVWEARTGRRVSELPVGPDVWELTADVHSNPFDTLEVVLLLDQMPGGSAMRRAGHASFSSDSRRLLVTSTRGATVWDPVSASLLDRFGTGEMVPVDQADWSADDSLVVLGAAENPTRFRLENTVPRIRESVPPLWLPRSGGDLTYLSPPLRADLLRFDARSGRALPAISSRKGMHEFERVGCGHARTANLVCLTTDDETVSAIRDVRSGARVTEIQGHLPGVQLTAMSSDGALLALSDQQTVEIWSTRTGRLQSRIAARKSYTVTGIEFDATGARLVTAGGQLEPVARVWDTATGRLVVELRGHTHSINAARFSPDGRLVVTASQDNTGRVWSVDDGRELMSLDGHQNMLYDARFSPDGGRVLSVSGDGTARVYDVSLAKPMAELLKIAQGRAPRDLTPGEAARYLH